MAKGMYIGVGNVARKVKKAYVGIGGVARKVKKMYIGVGGVARLCFSSGARKVSIANLTASMYAHAGVNNDNYALFGSGVVNAYSTNLSQTVPSALEGGTSNAAAKSGTYAVFVSKNITLKNNPVNGYNNALARSTAPIYGSYGSGNDDNYMNGISGGTLSNEAIFAGGQPVDKSYYSSTALKYDANLIKNVASTGLIDGRGSTQCASIGNYILFVGGQDPYTGVSKYVDAFTSSMVRTNPTQLNKSTRELKSASNSAYAIFPIMDLTGDGTTDQMVAYNSNLVRTDFSRASKRVESISSTSTPELAVFAGGLTRNPNTPLNTVSTYDKNLVRQEIESLDEGKFNIAGAAIGNYVIFAGGFNYTSPTEKVSTDAYEF